MKQVDSQPFFALPTSQLVGQRKILTLNFNNNNQSNILQLHKNKLKNTSSKRQRRNNQSKPIDSCSIFSFQLRGAVGKLSILKFNQSSLTVLLLTTSDIRLLLILATILQETCLLACSMKRSLRSALCCSRVLTAPPLIISQPSFQ